MANQTVAELESLLAKAKADAGIAVTYLKHVPWVRLGIVAASLLLLYILYKSGIESALFTVAYNIVILVIIITGIVEALIVWGNTKIECARIQYLQTNDGYPGPLGGGIAQQIQQAVATEVSKIGPKTGSASTGGGLNSVP